MSDISRITGMVSGIDTDQMVEDLMKAEDIKLNNLEKDKQSLEWEQEAYREVINEIREFQDKYFNYTSDTNLLSASTFNSNTASLSDDSLASYLNVSADSTASQGNYTISNITLATTASVTSDSSVSADIEGDTITASIGDPIVIDNSNDEFIISFNGESETITITEGSYTSLSDLQTEIQSQLDDAVGSGNVELELSGDDSSGQFLFTTDTTNTMTLNAADSALTELGFTASTLSNKIDLDTNLADITENFSESLSVDGSDDDISFIINGESFTFTSSTSSLQEIMDTVNESDAGVEIKYDELRNQFTIESEDTGSAEKIELSDQTGNLLGALQFDTSQSHYGSDASFNYDDDSGTQTITRASNAVSFNGLNIELEGNYSEDISFSIGSNSAEIVDTITSFVDDYNTLIEDINSKLDEEKDYDYEPLTDEEKEEMTDEEIEKWEVKAKAGILSDDNTLKKMLSKIRTALYEEVEGTGFSLYEIGIITSDDYNDQGKLVIDEDALAAAIEDNPEDVAGLFTANGDSYENKGLSHRLDDIIDANISTSLSSNGYRGTLLEIAGIENNNTENDNSITDKIKDLEDEIEAQEDRMSNLEDKYYNQFASMESALSQMDSISSYISSALG